MSEEEAEPRSIVHRKEDPERKEEEEEDEEPKGKRVTVIGRPMHFTGLKPSFAAYVTGAVGVGMCECTDTPCYLCFSSHKHRCIALQQPYSSVMYKTPPLYAEMYRCKVEEVPYHTLVVCYSALFSHLRDLTNAECPMMDQTWRTEANTARIRARRMWQPHLDQYKIDLREAFAIGKDPELGRQTFISVYQRVIAAGILACDCALDKDDTKFNSLIDQRIEQYNPPLVRGTMMKFAKGRVSELSEFNAKHTEWKLLYDIESMLKL